MYISNEHILTLDELDGFGAATINSVASFISSSSFKIMSLGDLLDILEDMLSRKLIKGSAKKKFPNKTALQEANARALRVLDNSDMAGIKMISRYAPTFPRNLLKTIDETGKEAVPLYLFYKGDLSVAQRHAVAIIGTREPSPEGFAAGEFIAAQFAQYGFNIVSGLALGCDTAGHTGALSVPGGLTTAVLAHGLDTVYPSENKKLADAILENGGLLMSEYPIGMGVNRYNLVARDRLQVGLGDATIVIQTGIHGGTMHAVNATLQAKKPLFVVDYSKPVLSEKIQGNHYLKEYKGAQGISAINTQEIINGLIASSSVGIITSLPKEDNHPNSPIQLELYD